MHVCAQHIYCYYLYGDFYFGYELRIRNGRQCFGIVMRIHLCMIKIYIGTYTIDNWEENPAVINTSTKGLQILQETFRFFFLNKRRPLYDSYTYAHAFTYIQIYALEKCYKFTVQPLKPENIRDVESILVLSSFACTEREKGIDKNRTLIEFIEFSYLKRYL